MTDGPTYSMNVRDLVEAEISGRLLAIELALGQLIFNQPNSRELLTRLEAAGDGIETGYASDIELVRAIGAACRQTMERLSGVVAMLEAHETRT